ncbi:GNAT family N-acetyltransferase [Halohasta salina]|uniref:GNAT family N-acetyltransferase n=1 Tax=Halohasta salina TaxID=2961621 RepID=UPI0020A2BC60|nr:GNAT family N-acetyltransferase [Halohasta salina]
MEFALLGWPVDEPRLRLDYRRFSYAGKFVTGNTGIAVARGEPPVDHDTPDGDDPQGVDGLASLPEGLSAAAFDTDILVAAAFNADRTDAETLWIRYLTVRNDLRGSGLRLGPRLAAFVTAEALDRGYDRVRIAVNNVFSYHALYRAGFGTTGRETGLAELILQRPTGQRAAVSTSGYQRGLDRFRGRDGLSAAEESFLHDHEAADPPDPVEDNDRSQTGTDDSGVSNPQGSSE